jgi:hypothetical protein
MNPTQPTWATQPSAVAGVVPSSVKTPLHHMSPGSNPPTFDSQRPPVSNAGAPPPRSREPRALGHTANVPNMGMTVRADAEAAAFWPRAKVQ